MEIDRVQLVKGLKVERTGSEQERRRRQQMEERFEDLLESTLEEDGREQQPPSPENEQPVQRDTVSISAANPALPLVNDLVSISTAGRVGAEVHNAGRSESDPREIERVLRQQELPLEVEPAAEPPASPESPAHDDTEGRHVDTVA